LIIQVTNGEEFILIIFRNGSFRNLFLGRVLSVLADSVMFFSLLKWIEIQSNGSSSFTWFYVAYYLPVTFLAIPIGSWIENKTLQKVMIFSDAIRVIILVIFPLIMYVIAYQWTYLLLMMVSVLGLFFIPANQSLLPYIVKTEDRAKANSLFQLGFTVVKIIGQISTAFLIKLLVPTSILLLSSAGLLFLSLLFIRKVVPLIKKEPTTKQSKIGMMKEGVSYIWSHPQFKPLFSFLAAAMFIATSIDLVLLSFLTEVLHIGVENLSFIATASGLGIIIGASLIPKLYKKIDRKWLIIPPLFALSISVGSMLFITNWLWILPLFFIQGVAFGGFNVTFVTYLQDEVISENFTRTFSIYNMISISMALPGVLVIGFLLNNIETMNTILFMAGMMLLLGIVGCYYLPRLGKGRS